MATQASQEEKYASGWGALSSREVFQQPRGPVMRRIMLAGCVVMAGCAIPPERAAQLASNSQEWELCYVAISGRGQPSIRQAAYDEMRRRGTDCNQHANLVALRMQQDGINQQQAMNALRMMQAARPQPIHIPATTQCRSVVNGNVVNTVCN